MGPGVSWVVPVVLLFPAIVPVTPLQMLVAGGIACSFDPLFHLAAMQAGVSPHESAADFFWHVFPNAIGAVLSMVPARVVRGLGRAVAEAREVGNYRLGGQLGKGGMGEVYVASHRLLARPAAIKMISAEQLGGNNPVSSEEIAERFRREASAAANLRSPHTIELYDFGTASDGTLYYAMELLDGITLHTLVDSYGAQPAGRVIHVLRQACLSLAEAHGMGLVHRDIKPSNLMLCRMGTEVDYLKVLDFGLVKASGGAPTDRQLTADHIAAGTPDFMAPESIEGVHGLDHRADLYALGCVAYWMLAGRPVFTGNTALAILMKHAREAPPPLSGTVGEVGADLQRVVFQCLEKDPARRPANALELEAALAGCAQASEWSRADAERWWAANLPLTPP
jgi:serine/threonine-protein kinase